VLAAALSSAPAAGQYAEAGRVDYRTFCTGCHGPEGRGDGPLAPMLSVETPDLTTLALRHGGRFPFGYAMEVIDGRRVVRAHGGEMPVWGNRYTADAMAQGASPEDAVVATLGRVLALVMYLEAIQQ
jgi:mono/diheme cytochrome c family protein